jgi:putative FmdB family regulatory protein
MPIYEYVCESCGHELEAMQKMSEAALTDCPACGRPALKKRISAAGFVLKGGGWYVTDFRDKGKKKDDVKKDDAKKESGGDTGSGGTSGGETSTAASCGSGACDTCSD